MKKIALISIHLFLFWFLPAFLSLILEEQTRKNLRKAISDMLTFNKVKFIDGSKVLGGFLFFCALGLISIPIFKLGQNLTKK